MKAWLHGQALSKRPLPQVLFALEVTAFVLLEIWVMSFFAIPPIFMIFVMISTLLAIYKLLDLASSEPFLVPGTLAASVLVIVSSVDLGWKIAAVVVAGTILHTLFTLRRSNQV